MNDRSKVQADEADKVQTERYAFNFLLEVSKKTSSIIDSFSNWLIGGFAAASTLLVSQYEQSSSLISPNEIKIFLILFAVSLASTVAQKFFFTLVKAQTESISASIKIVKKEGINGLDLEYLHSIVAEPFLPGFRYLVKRSLAKSKTSLSVAQLCLRRTHIQGLLCFFMQALVTVGAIVYIVCVL